MPVLPTIIHYEAFTFQFWLIWRCINEESTCKTYLSLSLWLCFDWPKLHADMKILIKVARKLHKIADWTKKTFAVFFWKAPETPKDHLPIFCENLAIFWKKVTKCANFGKLYRPDNNWNTSDVLHSSWNTPQRAKNMSTSRKKCFQLAIYHFEWTSPVRLI